LGLTDQVLRVLLIPSELDDVLLDLESVNQVLLHLPLLMVILGSIVELLEQLMTGQSRVVELEFLDQLLHLVNDVLREGSDHGVLDHVIVESVLDDALACVVVHVLLENLAGRVLPAAEHLGRLDNVLVELFQLGLHLLSSWLIDDLQVVVPGFHADQGLDFASVEQDCLVHSKGTDNHTRDGVEDPAFPVLVVGKHLRELTRVRLEGILFDHPEVGVTDRVVVLHQLVQLLEAGLIEPVHEVLGLLELVRSEVDLADDLGILDGLHLLLDVGSVREDTVLHLLKLVDGLLALTNILHDGEGEPVIVTGTLLHLEVQLTEHGQQELLLYRLESLESGVIVAQQLVKLVNVAHVIVLLESDVDDGRGDVLADAVEELGLADDHLQLGVEVHLEPGGAISLAAAEDVAREHGDRLLRVVVLPLRELLSLVLLGKLLRDTDVVLSSLLTSRDLCQDFGLARELVNGRLDPGDDAAGPGDRAGSRWHVLGNRCVMHVLQEELFHLFELIVVSDQHVVVLVVKFVFDALTGLDVLELAQEVKGVLRRIELLLESGGDQIGGLRFDRVNGRLEAVVGDFPVGLVLDVINIVGEVNELAHVVTHPVVHTVDVVSGAGDLLQVGSQDLLELFEHLAGIHDVLQDVHHVGWLRKDVLGVGELPAVHGVGDLDFLLGLIVLLLPVLEDADCLVDLLDRIRDWLLVEDLLDVDLLTDLGADLVRDGLKNVLELVFVLVNVTTDRPDQFQTVKERWKCLLDGLERPRVQITELTVQCLQELHKVLGLSVHLRKITELVVKLFESIVLVALFSIQNI